MARRTFKFNKLKELHAQIGTLIQESDDKLCAGEDNSPEGQAGAEPRAVTGGADDTPDNTPMTGATDARRARSMGEAFKDFNRIPNKM